MLIKQFQNKPAQEAFLFMCFSGGGGGGKKKKETLAGKPQNYAERVRPQTRSSGWCEWKQCLSTTCQPHSNVVFKTADHSIFDECLLKVLNVLAQHGISSDL